MTRPRFPRNQQDVPERESQIVFNPEFSGSLMPCPNVLQTDFTRRPPAAASNRKSGSAFDGLPLATELLFSLLIVLPVHPGSSWIVVRRFKSSATITVAGNSDCDRTQHMRPGPTGSSRKTLTALPGDQFGEVAERPIVQHWKWPS